MTIRKLTGFSWPRYLAGTSAQIVALLLLLVYAIVLKHRRRFVFAHDVPCGGLPDIGEPFDVEAFLKNDVPDEENAFTYYEVAARRLKPPSYPYKGGSYTQPWPPDYSLFWERVQDRDWLQFNRKALDFWRQGTSRDRIVPQKVSPSQVPSGTDWPKTMIGFAGLADLQGGSLAR